MSPVTRTRWVTFNCFGTLVDRQSRRPIDEMEAALARLRAKGYKLAVLTNSGDDQFEATHRSFRRPFDLFVTAERILGYKPAPWHFRAFELMTRVRKSDWVHVSSSVYNDIAPAEAFGVRSVWLDRARDTGGAAMGSIRVHDAVEIVDAIDGLFAQPAKRSIARTEPQLC